MDETTITIGTQYDPEYTRKLWEQRLKSISQEPVTAEIISKDSNVPKLGYRITIEIKGLSDQQVKNCVLADQLSGGFLGRWVEE